MKVIFLSLAVLISIHIQALAQTGFGLDIDGGSWNLGYYGANFTTSTTGGRWNVENTGTEEAAMLISVDPAEGWGVS